MEIIKKIFANNRVKSFLWRSGMMFIAGIFAVLVDVIGDIGLSGQTVVILGLVFGELSKAFANFAKENKV
jgi:hypothetical protein